MDPAFRRDLTGVERSALADAAAEKVKRMLREGAFQEAFAARRDLGLVALAAVFGRHQTRAELRQLAEQICRSAFERRFRIEEGDWEDFMLFEGEEHMNATLRPGVGCMVAAFHFDNYRLLAPYLVARGHDVYLLTDEKNSLQARAQMTEGLITKYLPGTAEFDGDARLSVGALRGRLHYLSSRSPSVAWDLHRALRKGATVLMFPDGNSGVEERGSDSNCTSLSFLGQTIQVRTGATAVAAMVGVDVLPVFPFEVAGVPGLRCEPPLRCALGEGRQAFRDRATRELFRLLERELHARPTHWEEWHQLPHWVTATPDTAPTFDPSQLEAELDGASEGARLRFIRPSLWQLRCEDGLHTVDTNGWHSLGRGAEFGEVVDAVERQLTLGQLMAEAVDASATLRALSILLGSGFVAVDRPASGESRGLK